MITLVNSTMGKLRCWARTGEIWVQVSSQPWKLTDWVALGQTLSQPNLSDRIVVWNKM